MFFSQHVPRYELSSSTAAERPPLEEKGTLGRPTVFANLHMLEQALETMRLQFHVRMPARRLLFLLNYLPPLSLSHGPRD